MVDHLISRTDTIFLTFPSMKLILGYVPHGHLPPHRTVKDLWTDWAQRSNPLLLVISCGMDQKKHSKPLNNSEFSKKHHESSQFPIQLLYTESKEVVHLHEQRNMKRWEKTKSKLSYIYCISLLFCI